MRLSELQERLLALLARDLTVREMAQAVAYSQPFVYSELRALRETLGVRTYAGAVAEGARLGLVKLATSQTVDKLYSQEP